MARKITKIIIHCSDSDYAHHDNILVIDKWHRERGFKKVAYHYFIRNSGDLEVGRDLEEIGAHCAHHNAESIGICVHGRHEFFDPQFVTLTSLVSRLLDKYKLNEKDIYLHNELDKKKTCPNFSKDEILDRLYGPFFD